MSDEKFYAELERQHLVALWRVVRGLMPAEPCSRFVPHLWRWKDLQTLATQAAELVAVDRAAERRVLGLVNPGAPETCAATPTLWAAVQILLPGEVAPAHRHSQGAVRFILQGEGAYTTVEGEKYLMRRGDLILTPPWLWHDHGSVGQEPTIWFDGLDIPLVGLLDASFFEAFQEERQRVAVGAAERWVYPWTEMEQALGRLGEPDASPFDDLALEYRAPSGGPVLPTIACRVERLRPGIHTRAHRHVSSAVHVVFEGSGFSVLNGERFNWEPGDMFAVPPWTWHEHANPSTDREAVLFSIHDTPVLRALGLYREEGYGPHGGHQPVD